MFTDILEPPRIASSDPKPCSDIKKRATCN